MRVDLRRKHGLAAHGFSLREAPGFAPAELLTAASIIAVIAVLVALGGCAKTGLPGVPAAALGAGAPHLAPIAAASAAAASAAGVPATTHAATAPSSAGFPVEITDALGARVVLRKPARRVVCLSPNLTEIVCYVGGIKQLVGVTEFCDYPPAALKKTRIGGIINPSFERILALRPDLVLAATGTDVAMIRQMRNVGLTVYASDPRSLKQVLALMETIGRLLGRATQAHKAANALRDRIDHLEREAARIGGNKHPSALLVVEVDPLFVAGHGTFVDDLLRKAGFRNAAAKAEPWGRWSSERLLYSQPNVVIVISGHLGGSDDEAPGLDLSEKLAKREPWSELTAVRTHHVYRVKDDYVTIPGPRLVLGLAQLVHIRDRYLAHPLH